jgi:hypothetical protein
MAPLFFTLGNRMHLMIIPDTEAHLDGHSIITHTYSIFKDVADGDPNQGKRKESFLHLDRIDDPDYLGYITFEKPGHLFSYTHNGDQHLDRDEVEELIEHLNHVRDNPSTWQHLNDL